MIKREGLRPLKTLLLILGEIPWDVTMIEQEQAALYKNEESDNKHMAEIKNSKRMDIARNQN